jgi:hypothetical protein
MTADLSRAVWREASRSNGQGGACVEVAFVPSAVGIRDSKNPTGPVLVFGQVGFAALVAAAMGGELDR